MGNVQSSTAQTLYTGSRLLAVITVPIHLSLPRETSYAVAAVILSLFAVVTDPMGQIGVQLTVALLFASFAVIA